MPKMIKGAVPTLSIEAQAERAREMLDFLVCIKVEQLAGAMKSYGLVAPEVLDMVEEKAVAFQASKGMLVLH